VSLLVEEATLAQNLDLLEINLEKAAKHFSKANVEATNDCLKHLIPCLLHNRCGGTVVIRGLLPLTQETSEQLDAALKEALKDKKCAFRFCEAFSQVDGDRMQNVITQCHPEPGAIITATGDALLILGEKRN
jgi:hypothetical protein